MSGLDLNTLKELYDWLDTIPFSKPKKNLARDFSDATLTAELIKYFFPYLVEIHNYPSTCTLEQKKINWSVLNQKVLKKLDYPISDITVLELASAKREGIEYFLNTLRWKIHDLLKNKSDKKLKDSKKSGDTTDRKHAQTHKSNCPIRYQINMKDSLNTHANLSKTNGIDLTPKNQPNIASKKDSIESFQSNATWVVKEVNLESLPPPNSNGTLHYSNAETIPRELYDIKIQELAEKKEEITILNARIQRLEYLLSFKDVTIARQEQLLQELRALQGGGEGRYNHQSFLKLGKSSLLT